MIKSTEYVASEYNGLTLRGWECPKCGRILAPHQDWCPFCVPKNNKSDSTGTTGTGRTTDIKMPSWSRRDNFDEFVKSISDTDKTSDKTYDKTSENMSLNNTMDFASTSLKESSMKELEDLLSAIEDGPCKITVVI